LNERRKFRIINPKGVKMERKGAKVLRIIEDQRDRIVIENG
jgi:hypothetical protein